MALELEGYDVALAANGVKLISSPDGHQPNILLLKPIDFEALVARMRELVERRGGGVRR